MKHLYSTNSDFILVTCGTGKTGRRVAQQLQERNIATRIGSRSAEPPFDWEDRATWAAALQDVTAVYVAYQPDLAVPGAVDTVSAFLNQAINAVVTKFVLLSGRGEDEAQLAERALQALDVDWTILRASWFCQNFSESFFLEPILAGEVALPGSLAAEPFVDVDDIAEIAVAALTDPRHARRLYEITGPQALTFAQAINQIAAATGRDIAYIPVSVEEYRAELIRQNVPSEYIELIMYLFTTVLDGRNTPLTDGVLQALGRPPRSFSDYVTRTALTGIWGNGG